MTKSGENIYDFIGNINPVLKSELGDTKYYIVGGVVTKLLVNNETVIDQDNEIVKPPESIYQSNYREDQSMRDLDIFILDCVEPKQIRYLNQKVSDSIDNRLVPSVFSLKKYDENRSHLKANLLDWLSRRTIDENGIIRYELFPLSQEVNSSSYEPWHFTTIASDELTPMLHPVGHVLAYSLRSIYGVKHKDQEKVSKMYQDIIYSNPSFANEIEVGIFKEWREFAESIEILNKQYPQDNSIKLIDFLSFRMKSNALSRLESHSKIVTLSYNKFITRFLSVIIHS